MEEIWKDIIGYEGLYMVSNYGRVKSLNYHMTGKEKILKAGKSGDGHLIVYLYKNGTKKPYQVHRLVAEAFLPNPENKPIAHHKDHNPLNNNVNNLVWLTQEEHKAEHPEVYEACGKGARKANSKPINQFTLDGLFLRAWHSAMDIERELWFNHRCIAACCKEKYKQAYGYIWKYADED